jgi:hypothetical protein
MIVTQFNTVALRLSDPRGSEVVHSRATGASPGSRFSFAPDPPTVDMLLQTAASSVRGWFQSWIAGVPASRYHTLSSHAVFQLLYAVGTVVRGLPPAQADPRGHAFPGHKCSASKSSSVPTPNSSVPIGQLGSNSLDDAVTVLNRLIALRTSGADVDKFWAALGEMHENAFAQRSAAVEHPSTPEYFPAPGNDVFNAMMAGGSEGSQPSLGDPYPLLQSQGSQAMYPFDIFIPPARVGSVAPGQREYNATSLLPPAQVPALRGGPQLSPGQPNQWTAAALWDAGPSSWTAPGNAADVMVPDAMDQRMWEAGQGNPPYGWEH